VFFPSLKLGRTETLVSLPVPALASRAAVSNAREPRELARGRVVDNGGSAGTPPAATGVDSDVDEDLATEALWLTEGCRGGVFVLVVAEALLDDCGGGFANGLF
jgi:hypothetical protein